MDFASSLEAVDGLELLRRDIRALFGIHSVGSLQPIGGICV